MDIRKLDGALNAALEKQRAIGEALSVFIRTNAHLNDDAKNILREYGIATNNDRATVFAADLSREQVESLSEQPFVQSIRLARQTRPLT